MHLFYINTNQVIIHIVFLPESDAAQRLVQRRFYHGGFPPVQLHRVPHRNRHGALQNPLVHRLLLLPSSRLAAPLSARRLGHEQG